MKTEQIYLARIANNVKLRIGVYESQANDYALKMNEDFENFFRWNSEDMYKAQLFLKHYRHLKEVVNGGDLGEVLNFLKSEVGRIERRLLNSQIHRSSSSQAGNVAFVLELEVEQKMRHYYLDMIKKIEL